MKKAILFTILLFHLGICYSQSISVSNFKLLESDLTANTAGTIERDQNGEVAALIKVVTTQTGFTFDCGSMGIVKTVQKPAEIWVYVPHGIKKMTISHPQLGLLRDYYLNVPIEKARTYEMVLASGTVQTIINQDAGGQYLIMTVDPPSATVFIDDSEVTVNNGVISKFLSYGSHNYRISDPLYQSDAGTFEIGKEKKEINAKLLPSYGVLEISTTPENGAKVFLDSDTEPMGMTPFTTKKIIKGDHRFRFQMPSYESKTMTYNIHSDGSTKPLSVALTPNFANITIKVPEGCTLYINNENKGNSDWSGRLSEGLYLIEARKESHVTTKQTITVVKGEEQKITLPNPTPIYGGLNINSTPIGAKVLIDGKEIGKTPEIFNQILIGKHILQIIKDGYESETRSIDIEKGIIAQITAELKENKAVVSQKNNVNTSLTTPIDNRNSIAKRIEKPSGNPKELAKIYSNKLSNAIKKIDKEKKIITENQISLQMGRSDQKSYDEIGLADAICDALNDIIILNEFDTKQANKYIQSVWENRVHLVNIGQEEARKNNDAAVLKYWGTFVDSRNEPLFAAMNKTYEEAYIGQVALFAGRYAYQANEYERAIRYFDVAMKDPEQKKEALNFKLFAMKSQLKTRQDSLNYAEQLKGLMADNPDNDVILDGLYQMYEGMKMKAEQKSLLEGILAKNPNSFVALADMGIMYMGENDAAGAIPYLRKAVEVKDDNVSVLYYLATSLCVVAQDEKTTAADKKNYYKEAVGLYDKCKQLDPDMMQIKWGYNRFNAYYNFYGPEAPETKQAEADYKN